MSSINVSDSTPSLQDDKDDDFSKHVKAFSKKMDKIEADHEKQLMAVLSSADSLRQVKQILSDGEELSENIKRVVFDVVLKKEKEEEKASEVLINRIMKKIRIMKKRERQRELSQLLKKNEAELKKTNNYASIFETLTPSQIQGRQSLLNLELDLLAEFLWTMKETDPYIYDGDGNLRSANSCSTGYPELDTQSLDMNAPDSKKRRISKNEKQQN